MDGGERANRLLPPLRVVLPLLSYCTALTVLRFLLDVHLPLSSDAHTLEYYRRSSLMQSQYARLGFESGFPIGWKSSGSVFIFMLLGFVIETELAQVSGSRYGRVRLT